MAFKIVATRKPAPPRGEPPPALDLSLTKRLGMYLG
jgi:hypothetical protein